MFAPHRHDGIEINFSPRKAFRFLCEEKSESVAARAINLFWANHPHQAVGGDETQDVLVFSISLSVFLEWNLPESLVGPLLQGCFLRDIPDIHAASDESFFRRIIEEFPRSLKDSASGLHQVHLMELRARLHRLAAEANRSVSPLQRNIPKILKAAAPTCSLPRAVEKMTDFVCRNYAESITALDVARVSGLHPGYASNLFRKYMGVGLKQYLIRQRLTRAQYRLLTSPLSVAEIAYEAGFQSLCRFHADFQQHFGTTPKRYRMQFQSSFL